MSEQRKKRVEINSRGETAPLYRTRPQDAIPGFIGIVKSRSTKALEKASLLNKEQTLIITGDNKLKFEIPNYDKALGLSPTQHQLLCFILQGFTAKFSKDNTAEPEYLCYISVPQFLELKGVDVRDENAFKNGKKNIRRNLKALQRYEITWEERIQGKEKRWADIKMIGSATNINKDTIAVAVDVLYAQALLETNSLTQYPQALYRLTSHEATAYAVGCKLSNRWHYEREQRRGQHDILGVKAILEASGLPTLNSLIAHNNHSKWNERIKEPLENALERLVEIGLLNTWEYVKSKKEPLTEDDVKRMQLDFNFYENLYIKYDLNGKDVRKKLKKG